MAKLRNLSVFMQYLIVLIAFFQTLEARAFSFAEMSYSLIHGSCQKNQNSKEETTASKSPCSLNCAADSLNSDPRSCLKEDAQNLTENIYLASLAQKRAAILECRENQIKDILNNPDSRKAFVEDAAEKVAALGFLKKRLEILTPAVASNKKAAEEYRSLRLQAEAISEALQFTDMRSMKLTINSLVGQSDQFSDEGPTDYIKDQILKSIEASLSLAAKEISKERITLDKGVKSLGTSLDNRTKESLAQDTDLIEAFRQDKLVGDNELKPIACQVDSKYGKGAAYRDQAIDMGLMVVGGVAGGLAKGVSKLATAVTGAASNGVITVRAARILRVIASAGELVVPLNEAKESCIDQAEKLTGTQCESPLKALNENNCLLSVAFSYLGVKGVSETTKKALSPVIERAQKARESLKPKNVTTNSQNPSAKGPLQDNFIERHSITPDSVQDAPIPPVKRTQEVRKNLNLEIASPKNHDSATKVYLKEKEPLKQIPLQDYKRVKETVAWSNENLFANMDKPDEIGLVVQKNLSHGFDQQKRHLRRPPSDLQADLERTVDAHEYGHAVFSKNMRKYSDEWRKWQEDSEKYFSYVAPTDPAVVRLRERMDKLRLQDDILKKAKYDDPQKMALVDAKRKSIRSESDFLLNKSVEMRHLTKKEGGPPYPDGPRRLYKTSTAYQELFSDLTAVLQFPGRKGYAKSIEYEEISASRSEYLKDNPQFIPLGRKRYFSEPTALKGWNKVVDPIDPHVTLNPTRSFLYRNYLSNPKTMNRLNEFMPKVFDSLAKEVIEQSKNPKFTLEDAEALNRSLIKRLEKDLKEFKK